MSLCFQVSVLQIKAEAKYYFPKHWCLLGLGQLGKTQRKRKEAKNKDQGDIGTVEPPQISLCLQLFSLIFEVKKPNQKQDMKGRATPTRA